MATLWKVRMTQGGNSIPYTFLRSDEQIQPIGRSALRLLLVDPAEIYWSES